MRQAFLFFELLPGSGLQPAASCAANGTAGQSPLDPARAAVGTSGHGAPGQLYRSTLSVVPPRPQSALTGSGVCAARLRAIQQILDAGRDICAANELLHMAAEVDQPAASGRCRLQAGLVLIDCGQPLQAAQQLRIGLQQLTSTQALLAERSTLGPTEWLALAAGALATSAPETAAAWTRTALCSLQRRLSSEHPRADTLRLTADAFTAHAAALQLLGSSATAADCLRSAYQLHRQLGDDISAAGAVLWLARVEQQGSPVAAAASINLARQLLSGHAQHLPGSRAARLLQICDADAAERVPQSVTAAHHN